MAYLKRALHNVYTYGVTVWVAFGILVYSYFIACLSQLYRDPSFATITGFVATFHRPYIAVILVQKSNSEFAGTRI
ncbi:MAG: hypothetical protein ACKOAV_06755, partial [Bacteroidota bacterium]